MTDKDQTNTKGTGIRPRGVFPNVQSVDETDLSKITNGELPLEYNEWNFEGGNLLTGKNGAKGKVTETNTGIIPASKVQEISNSSAGILKAQQQQAQVNITYGDKMKSLITDGSIRTKIYELINSGHLRIAAPILRLDIISQNKDFELDQEDLRDVFSRYGEVVDVVMKPPQAHAYIVFTDVVSAVFAKKCLHGYYLGEVDVKLLVSWFDYVDNQPPPTGTYSDVIEYYEMLAARGHYAMNATQGGSHMTNGAINNNNNNNGNGQGNLGDNGQFSAMGGAMNKLTCRYEIQIENDKEFQVARKIIGAKGSNMKRIIECCNAQMKNGGDPRGGQGELVKLRLRGRGSGFKEGPDRQESQDPLHLCISAKSKDVYELACQLVEELITTIYDEYRKFCQSRGRPLKVAPGIKKIETFPWTKQSNSNYPDVADLSPYGQSPNEYGYQTQPQQQQQQQQQGQQGHAAKNSRMY
jgi:hypothetical protein